MPLPDELEFVSDVEVVCLPDLFLDHVVHLPPIGEAEATIRKVHGRGGGKVLDVPQQVLPGGNAANTAHALARLDASVRLIGRTSPRGRAFFQSTVGADGVGMELVDGDGELAATTVLAYGEEGTNVMLNDPGSVEGFGPADLQDSQRQAIREADAVLVANWASMTRHGTELVQNVVELAYDAGTHSYLDAADPSRRDDARQLVDALEQVPLDVWAMNDAEARLFSGGEDPAQAARDLWEQTGARVDVHDADKAVSVGGQACTRVPAFPADPVHLTGAGDAFNAGNLLGHLGGLEPEDRLRLAHAVAACTIERPAGTPPSIEELGRRYEGGD